MPSIFFKRRLDAQTVEICVSRAGVPWSRDLPTSSVGTSSATIEAVNEIGVGGAIDAAGGVGYASGDSSLARPDEFEGVLADRLVDVGKVSGRTAGGTGMNAASGVLPPLEKTSPTDLTVTPQSDSTTFRLISLPGITDFDRVRELQLELLQKRMAGEIPDTWISCEHAPVITRGRGLQRKLTARSDALANTKIQSQDTHTELRQMPFAPGLQTQIPYRECERGGDLTYHGPGQWVLYPIVALDGQGIGPYHDIEKWIRRLESMMIEFLVRQGLPQGESRPGASGVWVHNRKIASIGIAVRRWVNYHGIALNVVNDLSPYFFIQPCGFAPEQMTRVQDFKLASRASVLSAASGPVAALGDGNPDGEWNGWRQDYEDRWVELVGERLGKL